MTTLEERYKANGQFAGIINLLYAIAKIGVPSAIAMYLVYELVSGFKQDLSQMQRSFDAHSITTLELNKQYEQVRIQVDKQTWILQRICVNSAKTATAINECLAR